MFRIHTSFIILSTLMASSLFSSASEQTKDHSKSQNLALHLIRNERTSHTTARCSLRAGFQFAIEFLDYRNGTEKIELKTRNINTEKITHWKGCSRDRDKLNEIKCYMWSLRVPNVLFDEHNRPTKYELWAENGSTVIWKYGKPFNLLEHFFGCRPKFPFSEIEFEDVEMSSFVTTWRLHRLTRKLFPKFQVILDGQQNENIITKCKQICKCNMVDVDTCVKHKVCIKVDYNDTLFSHMPNKTDYSCAIAPAWKNCTELIREKKTGDEVLVISTEITIVLITFFVILITVLMVTLYCKIKKHRKQTSTNKMKGKQTEACDRILPRDTILSRDNNNLYMDIEDVMNKEVQRPILSTGSSRDESEVGEVTGFLFLRFFFSCFAKKNKGDERVLLQT